MERRKFLKSAGAGIATGAAMMPTLSRAQTAALPEIKWRLASSFPKSLDTIYGAAEVMAKRVAACTGGKFQIQVFAGGEIMPAFGVVDAVQNGTVQVAHTAPYYFWGKDPAFALDYRDTLRPQLAPDERLADTTATASSCSVSSTRATRSTKCPAAIRAPRWAAGSARRSRRSPTSRASSSASAASAGKVIEKLGGVPQNDPGRRHLSRRSRRARSTPPNGSAPTTTRSSGSTRSRRTTTIPGWWEGGPQLDAYFNIDEWNKLPKEYQDDRRGRVLARRTRGCSPSTTRRIPTR